MKIEHVVSLVFSEEEVKNALLNQLERAANYEIEGSPENLRLRALVEHAKNTTSCIDYAGGEYHLLLDGVAQEEEI